MAKGWIQLHRKLLESDIWTNNQPFDMRSAWIDLLLSANHEDMEMIFDYKTITIQRGQLLTSVRNLGNRWKWGKDRVLKYLRLLERLGMVTKNSTNSRTLLTIENYEKYQSRQDTDEDTDKDTGEDTEQTQDRHGSATNNNVNNENNENKKINIIYTKYSSSFSEFWKCYPRKQDKGMAYEKYLARLNDGYSEEELLTACKNYAAECEKEKRDKKYIKHASTFLGVHEPFAEYLKGETNDSVGRISERDEEQHNAELDAYIKRMESGEFDAEDEELRRMWDD